MKTINLTWAEIYQDTKPLIERISENIRFVYGIPTGGSFIAQIIHHETGLPLLNEMPSNLTEVLIVDDLVDTGRTIMSRYANFHVATVYRKPHSPPYIAPHAIQKDGWLKFPWENEGAPIDAVTRIISFIDPEPNREGLEDTPDRILRSWGEIFSGYKMDPADIFTKFASNGNHELVMLKDIELYSMCEHHMLPFVGRAHVAYIPDKELIGISKLARLVDIYARRLQIQERIGQQVTGQLMKYLQPKAAACIIEAEHLCMRMRGVGKQHSIMVTSSLKGGFLDDPSSRAELMRLIS